MPIGSCWASGSWVDDAWAPNTWVDLGSIAVLPRIARTALEHDTPRYRLESDIPRYRVEQT